MGLDRKHHRKRMRGAAMFFIVVSAFALIVGSIAFASSSDPTSTDKYLTLVIGTAGTLIGALIVWNGSIIGAAFLILWVASGYLGDIEPVQLAAPQTLVRTTLYLVLSVWMLRHLIRYRQLGKQNDEPIGGSAIIRWGGKALISAIVALVGVGVWMLSTGISTAVISGTNIPEDQVQWMREQHFLQENETPLLFYSEGVVSIAEGGNLLTDRYVGAWGDMSGEESADAWIRLGEICRTETVEKGSYLSDAVYRLHSFGDNTVEIWLSIEAGEHETFLARMNNINERKMHPEVRNACDEGRSPDWDLVARSNGIPDGIVGADRLTLDHKVWLEEHEYLTEDEKIEKFFSYGHYSIAWGGTLFTDQYFGGWYEEYGTTKGWWTKLGEICSISRVEETRTDGLVRYKVVNDQDSWMKVRLPAGNPESELLVFRVLEENETRQSDESIKKCAAIESATEANE